MQTTVLGVVDLTLSHATSQQKNTYWCKTWKPSLHYVTHAVDDDTAWWNCSWKTHLRLELAKVWIEHLWGKLGILKN